MATINQLPSGKWRAQVRIKGHAPISKTHRTKAQAERWAVQVEDRLRSGTYQDVSGAAAIRLVDHLQWYVKAVISHKSKSNQVAEISRIRVLSSHPAFAHCTLATLSPESVTSYIQSRKDSGIDNSTIVRDLCVLSHAIDAAIGLRRLALPHGNPVAVARNTLKFTRALSIDDARDRRLQAGELELVLAELGPVMQGAVMIYLETGMRREELCNARREHIRGNTLHIPQAKTGARTIPLSVDAVNAIRSLPVRMDGFLLGMRPDSVTQAFSRACRRAGIENLRVHDLRHEATSRLFERGWSVPEVAAVTGHSDWRSLARYTQISPEHLAGKLRENL